MTRLTIGLLVLLMFLLACGGSTSHRGTGQFLFISDQAANRVLVYQSLTLTTGDSAIAVLGQASLSASVTVPAAPNTLLAPVSQTLDSAGNLWVSDSGNCRVLKFPKPFTTDESATVAVGQTNLATGCGFAASAIFLGGVGKTIGGIAFDAAGNLWVADTANNRVLGFPAATLAASGGTATGVLGQTDFVSTAPNRGAGLPTASTLSAPASIAFDSAGNLWVVDQGNNRVVGYPQASVALPAAGPAATAVIGQPGFVTDTPNNPSLGPATLNHPSAVAFDSSGNMLITDTGNNRVLFYPKASVTLPAPAGPSATLALGQIDFLHNAPNQGLAAPTAATLAAPAFMVFDSTGRAIVTDTGNNRTLIYPAPLSTNEIATTVIGQTDFTHSGAAVTSQGQNSPAGVTTTF
jgi:hypothetical protein